MNIAISIVQGAATLPMATPEICLEGQFQLTLEAFQ